ncbi:MAG: hypothetical protein M0Z50_15555 [Planctomycetia bacterium]|nr:hypothetical protein [Planctomycetia bacterium]
MIIIGPRTETLKDIQLYQNNGWGRMYINRRPTPYQNEPWGWDNGAYQAFQNGTEININEWIKRTEKIANVPAPYLCVLPDIVGGGKRSLQLSINNRIYIPEDWPAYLPVQDGITENDVIPYLHMIDGIFLGGTTTYKKNAAAWSDFAHTHDIKFHYARAGTRRKLQDALLCGSDSVDTACPLWIPRQMKQFKRWTIELNTQRNLFV